MKNIFSCKKIPWILLLITLVSFGFYAYMLVRPVSYGMEYRNVTVYDGDTFEGKMIFKLDGTLTNENTNYGEELISRYYYKDGYVFFVMSATSEGYEKEVAYIHENFDEAKSTPFYAAKINAFSLSLQGIEDYENVYTCNGATVFAAVAGAAELILIGLTATAFLLSRKTKREE